MDTEKFFVVDWFSASTEEDSYKDGILPNSSGSSWGEGDMGFKSGYYRTIEDALKAVCEANYFDYDPDSWEYFEDGQFNGQFMVDVNNSEATDGDIEEWKKGRKRLWCCDISVHIKKQSLAEDVTDEECENWKAPSMFRCSQCETEYPLPKKAKYKKDKNGMNIVPCPKCGTYHYMTDKALADAISAS